MLNKGDPHLYPNTSAPVQLDENFYLKFLPSQSPLSNQPVSSNPTFPPVAANSHQPPPSVLPTLRPEPLAEKLIRQNQELIQEEALKQVVANATNVNASQYKDLIPISFDEAQFIREEEEKRQRKREKAAALVLRR